MGKVVKLEPNAKDATRGPPRERPLAPRGVGRPGAVDRRRRPRRDKTALVLGGGGFTGGVYEIGALRALDLLAVNSSVNEFDVYVGTSAGSFIAAMCANGVSPDEMMRVLLAHEGTLLRAVDLGDLLSLNFGGLLRKSAHLPLRMFALTRQLVAQRGLISAIDVLVGLADGLPAGIYTGAGIERYLHDALEGPGRSDDFRELDCELYLTATDLDTCERVVFGTEDNDDVPISTAVRASGALPMVYAPVRVDGRDLVDGGLRSTTNLDIAVQAGAKLVVVINPIVPFVGESGEDGAHPPRAGRVAEMGFAQIGYQAFKLLAHQRLHEQAKHWEQTYPSVDIVLIEPESDDELMFQTSMMNFTSRVEIARHGFQSVSRQLAADYERFGEIAARHEIEISAERLSKMVEGFDGQEDATGSWRRVLSGTAGALLRQTGLAG
jgi:NTE family protein